MVQTVGCSPVADIGMNSREAAYQALLYALKEEGFIHAYLDKWRQAENPSSVDFNLAQEIAYGSCRMALALDFLGASLAGKEKLSLKLKERALLRTAIYQHFFMERIPLYAIVNETLNIAKKHCHSTFAGFLNAILRKMSEKSPTLPQGDTPEEMSTRLSYPLWLVQQLIQDYGLPTAKKIMEAQNLPSPTMARTRIHSESKMITIKDSATLAQMAASPDFYIQNGTPALLMEYLGRTAKPPKRILDLCASPGGKLLAAHDLFPNASLVANDVSEEKLKPLRENIAKYRLQVELNCGLGEQFSDSNRYDLIILDVPCSNSGVLNKRPEARWRITDPFLKELETTQLRLAQHAASLLAEGGEIWYMTCSILKRENEEMVSRICDATALLVKSSQTMLPNSDGFDGGYGAVLQNSGIYLENLKTDLL